MSNMNQYRATLLPGRRGLYEVNQHDPVTIFSVCALLSICALVAALIPARRAASIDPMQALRTE